MGDRKTPEECQSMLEVRLEGFYGGAVACVPRLATQSPNRIASHVSLAYNIGVGAYCQSTVARRANAGDWIGSCDAFLMWNKAKGIPLPGLTRRRAEERRLCLQSTANSP
jgi:lysozyme